MDSKSQGQTCARKGAGRIYRRLSYLAVGLALVVVVLGAYVRLSNAGLGCPGWQTCSGHQTVGTTEAHSGQIVASTPNQPVEPVKANKGMVQRYASGTLGILVLMLVGFSWWCQRHRTLLTILAGLILFQALLGMWTVTMKLMPLMVTGHHLGGMTVLALLWWVLLDNRYRQQLAHGMVQTTEAPSRLQLFASIGLVLLVLQIFLGGWTSSNYAGLACTGFPSCNGQWWPQHADFVEGFSLHDVDVAGLVAIQWVHRLGALIVFIYLGALAIFSRSITPRIALAIGLFLLLQVALGIGNVLSGSPLQMADAHNAVAALLLMSVIALNHRLNHGLSNSRDMVPKGELS